MTDLPRARPAAWAVLAQAIEERHTVRARYHGHERLLCPHALGWKNGRAKVLAYQSAGSTSSGLLPQASRDRWRSLFVDEIEDPTIVPDAPWNTADNYTAHSNGIEEMEVLVALN
jgi:WYL domain